MINTYVDIHTHILPRVDDGAQSLKEMKQMLALANKEGIGTIFATPHYIPGENQRNDEIEQALEQVRVEAEQISKDMKIYSGNEIYFNSGTLSAIKCKEAKTLAQSRYVLIECSCGESYDALYKGMRDILLEGYIPILAHIERYQCLLKRIDRVKELVELGCYMQVNVNSIETGLLSLTNRYITKLVKADLVHFLASDCHNTNTRAPKMQSCIEKYRKIMNEDQFQKIFYTNPKKLLENKII